MTLDIKEIIAIEPFQGDFARITKLLGAETINKAKESVLWSAQKQSRFIESFLLAGSSPLINAFPYVTAESGAYVELIDGWQRLGTIANFLEDGFSLSDLEFMPEFNGMRYSDLDRPMQRRIEWAMFVFQRVRPTYRAHKYSTDEKIELTTAIARRISSKFTQN